MGYYYGHSNKRTRGGLVAVSKRGSFGVGALARRWVDTTLCGLDEHVQKRSASLARGGYVLGLQVIAGKIVGQTLNDYSYSVNQTTITLPAYDQEQWRDFAAYVRGQPPIARQMLMGQIPPVVEAWATAARMPLLPSAPGEITTDCGCYYSYNSICQHVGALLLHFGEALDVDPFHLLLLRGADRADFYGVIARDQVPQPQTSPLPTDPVAYWNLNPPPHLAAENAILAEYLRTPLLVHASDYAVPIPFWSGNYEQHLLSQMAGSIGEIARATFQDDHTPPSPEDEEVGSHADGWEDEETPPPSGSRSFLLE